MRLYADADTASLGIVTGCENGTFQLTRELSHQEAAVILHRLYNVLYGTVSSGNSAEIYADNGSIGLWAKDSVYAMQQGGILQGKSGSKFCPKDGCTIEQALVTMLRMTQRRNQGGKSCVL